MRLLMIEDDASVARMVQLSAGIEGHDVTIASSGREGLDLARRARPDAILLDLGLPDTDGRDMIRRLREQSGVPIIVVTGRADVADRVDGLDLGADDYVVKPFSTAELLARVRAVTRRAREQELARTRSLVVRDIRFDLDALKAFRVEAPLALGAHELELLRVLMENAGDGVSRDELASQVWGIAADDGRVDAHVDTIVSKLGAAEPPYIVASGDGYRLDT